MHPTPLYELLVSSAIGWLLWRLGTRFLKSQRHPGEIFAYYLILTGVARFLVEIIRINPPWIFGLSNAQVAEKHTLRNRRPDSFNLLKTPFRGTILR